MVTAPPVIRFAVRRG